MQGSPPAAAPQQQKQSAQRGGARRLVLTHFYPACDGVDLVAQARARFDGEVLMGRDLMQVELDAAR